MTLVMQDLKTFSHAADSFSSLIFGKFMASDLVLRRDRASQRADPFCIRSSIVRSGWVLRAPLSQNRLPQRGSGHVLQVSA